MAQPQKGRILGAPMVTKQGTWKHRGGYIPCSYVGRLYASSLLPPTKELYQYSMKLHLILDVFLIYTLLKLPKYVSFFINGVIGDRQDRKILENWHTKKVQLMIKS